MPVLVDIIRSLIERKYMDEVRVRKYLGMEIRLQVAYEVDVASMSSNAQSVILHARASA